MNRQFVNLVVANCRSHMYVVHRIDASSKHLFYPSTAEAARTHAREPKPLWIQRLQRLPAQIAGFESSPPFFGLYPYRSWWDCNEDMFVLLHGPRGRYSGEPSRILHANGAGHVTLYDADSGFVVSVPDLAEPKGYKPITFAIIAGAAGGHESLYVMRSAPVQPARNNGRCSLNFEVLDFGSGYSCPGHRSRLQWQPLPPPPMADGRFDTSTVLDGGQTICVSSESNGTFCFDTASREWCRSGDWRLPFKGTAEYVPELGTWLGFSDDHPHHLCAADLSGVAMAGPRAEKPALQHVWEDLNTPPDVLFPCIYRSTTVKWMARQLHLVNLGSGRFCIAKVFEAEETVSISNFETTNKEGGRLTVLIGVEVARGGEGEELRMIKHKTMRFMFPGKNLKCVL